jgi:hypothetical protein
MIWSVAAVRARVGAGGRDGNRKGGNMSSTEAEPADSDSTESPAGEDDVRRKFKEALERKHHQQAAGSADSESKDPSKVHQSHGPAGSKRSFRRKSG